MRHFWKDTYYYTQSLKIQQNSIYALHSGVLSRAVVTSSGPRAPNFSLSFLTWHVESLNKHNIYVWNILIWNFKTHLCHFIKSFVTEWSNCKNCPPLIYKYAVIIFGQVGTKVPIQHTSRCLFILSYCALFVFFSVPRSLRQLSAKCFSSHYSSVIFRGIVHYHIPLSILKYTAVRYQHMSTCFFEKPREPS
jgi:hypothetical protein